jgi:hypothetical protein
LFLVGSDDQVRSTAFKDSAQALTAERAFLTYALTVEGIHHGQYEYRIRISDPLFAEGMVYGGRVDVADYQTGGLAMSDLVVARDSTPGSLKRLGVSLSPYLGAVTDRRFATYWEVYGAPPGTLLRVSLRILGERRLLGRRRELDLTFDEEVPADGSPQMLKSIEHGLPPGRYTLRVEVQSEALKASVSREAVLAIR